MEKLKDELYKLNYFAGFSNVIKTADVFRSISDFEERHKNDNIEFKMKFDSQTTVKELFATTLEIFKNSSESFGLGNVVEIKHCLVLKLKDDPDHVIEISCLKRELTKSEKEDRDLDNS